MAMMGMLLLGGGATGCFDTRPVYVVRDAEVVTDGQVPEPCTACGYRELTPEGLCAAEAAFEYEQCAGYSSCFKALRCIVDSGCLSSEGDLFVCGFPCALENGVDTVDDPLVAVGTRLYTCIVDSCASACGR